MKPQSRHKAGVHVSWPLLKAFSVTARLPEAFASESMPEQTFAGKPEPDFFCVGAQKAGTTWLYYQLAAHPDFWMPPLKEVHYFDQLSRTRAPAPPVRDSRDACFLARVKRLSEQSHIDLENYARLFEPKGALLSGDITPAYSMLNEELIERIAARFPNARVIFIARDPVERAWSQLSMGVRLQNIDPFDVTDANEVIRNLLNPGVLLRSYPTKIVARWKRYVRPELFRVFFFDELEENPGALRRSILDFLGSDPQKAPDPSPSEGSHEKKRKKLPLNDRARAALAHFFKDELKACAKELGGPARTWPARYGFSFVVFLWQIADYLDLFFWCDLIA